MGLFNRVLGQIRCSRCQAVVEADVETRLGDMSQTSVLHLGDSYPWRPDQRPDAGTAVGDGYCECPACHKDFFVNVQIENDLIVRIEIDASRSGYIAD